MRVEESSIILEGIDWKEIARYVGNNRGKTGDLDWVRNLLPWRAKKGGVDPGMKNKEMTGKAKGTEITWKFPKREATKKQLRKLAARTV